MTTKELNNLIIRLKTFNDWRRGTVDVYDIDAAQIGKDIDSSIEILKRSLEISKMVDGFLGVEKLNKNVKSPEFITKKDYYD